MRCLFLAGLVLLVCPATAHATDDAQAETLHAEAGALLDQGKLDEACPRFDDAYRASLRVAHLIDAADCYERAGKTGSAWERFRAASGAAERYGEDDVGRVVDERRARLEPNLTLLTIEVAPAVRATPGLALKVNQRAVPLDLAVPVDPGTVTVDADAPERLPFHAELTAAGPGELRVRVEKLEPRSEPVPVNQTAAVIPMVPHQPPAQPAETTNVQKTVGYVVGGVGLVGLTLGVAFNLKARSEADEANTQCLPGQPAGSPCTVATERERQMRQETVTSASSSSTASYVLLGLGTAALATGAVLVLTSGSEKHLSASISDRHVAITFGGSL